MKTRIVIFILMLNLTFVTNIFADTNFRVMSYNALNFDGTDRLTDFQTVFEEVQPDILITQEIKTESASDVILNILNTAIGGYARADFVLDTDLNNMLYYKTSLGILVSQDEIDTSPRDISEYVLNIDENPIRFYSCHLKSSQGSTYEAERLAAVTILRDHLNGLSAGTEFIIVGDMNFYTSSEDGYQKFIADEINNIGRAEDLCSEVGSWNNNATYASVHSQSSRLTAFGGGASGGLDDKFDFIFGNYGINNGSGIEYSTGSFISCGNDGNHFNLSINDGTNSAVPDSVADALYYASDHLPVYADFVSLSGTLPNLFISEYVEGSSNNKYLEIFNATGSNVSLNYWKIEIYYNGNTTPGSTISLSGTIANEDVFVLAHSSAVVWSGTPDQTSSSLNFNGDDAVALERISVNVDVIGQIGVQQVWGTGEVTTQNHTLRRKSEITEGDSDGYDVFDPTIEWDGYSQDTVDNLGFHIAGPLNAPTNVTIMVSETSVTISWDEVVGASVYHIYSSDYPQSGFELDHTGSFNNNSWTTSIQTARKFYYITAE